ncbi:MAG: FliM/FliN family flagellar motor switch protein [Bryobacterales bacterium]|nr:FliM/FliN family flagellar motor switch protein [Bryobacterales bacterium]
MAAIEEIAGFGDVRVPIEVEISRPLLKLGEILTLRPGKLVGLERSAGENIDIRAAGVLIGYGEVIVSEGVVGVRITDFKAEG